MPKSLQRWVTSLSVSSKVPSSSRNSMRSRTDILPSLCWRSRLSEPPPASASESRRLSSSSFCSRFIGGNYRVASRQLLVASKNHPFTTERQKHREIFDGFRLRALSVVLILFLTGNWLLTTGN